MKKLLIILSCVIVTSCSSNSGNEEFNSTKEYSYHTDIKPIFDAKCGSCHQDGGIAPFSTSDFASVSKWKNPIKNTVNNRSMPPWMAEKGVRDYKYDNTLTDKEILMISDWVDGGAKEGDINKPGEKIQVDRSNLSQVDLRIEMPKPYTPVVLKTEYRCITIDWPETETKYITGVRVKPGSKDIVHHVVLYHIQPAQAELVAGFEAKEEEPGYLCFGGPTPKGAAQFPTSILGAWAPGTTGVDFPKGTGIEIKPGSKIVLQMHYTIFEVGQSDQSSVEFSLSDSVEKRGLYLPWFDLNWGLKSEAMKIPANDKAATHIYEEVANRGAITMLLKAGLDFSNGMIIHSINPHLHLLGKNVDGWVQKENGEKRDLIKIKEFDYDWQREYYLKDPEVLEKNDKIGIRCEWDNSKDNMNRYKLGASVNDEPSDVYWGDGSLDEMCVLNLYVTEK